MNTKFFLALALVAIVIAMPESARLETETSNSLTQNPLAGFERLIGGQWHLEGSYQEFEWGAGQRSVKAKSYFLVEGAPKLVSEGIWFWHPEAKEVRGIFTAVGMPVELFEYTTHLKSDSIVSDLAAYSSEGLKTLYTESWQFIDDTHYEWTLFAKTPDGPQKEMGGTYTRKD